MGRDIKRALGKRIRELRKSHGWSQEEMGEASDLHWTYIGQVERGERNPTLLTVHAISKAFRMKISELVRGID